MAASAATLYGKAQQAYSDTAGDATAKFTSMLRAIGSDPDVYYKNILDLRHDAGRLVNMTIPGTEYSIASMTDVLGNSLVAGAPPNIGTVSTNITSDESILDKLESMSPYYFPETDSTKINKIAAADQQGSTFKIYPYTRDGMRQLSADLTAAGCARIMIDAFFGNPFRFKDGAGGYENGFGNVGGVQLINHVVSECDGATKAGGASLGSVGVIDRATTFTPLAPYTLPAFYSKIDSTNARKYTTHNFSIEGGQPKITVIDTENATISVKGAGGFSVNSLMKAIGMTPPRGAAKIIKNLTVTGVSNDNYGKGHIAYIKTITDWAQYAVALENGLTGEKTAVFLNDRFGLRMTGILGNHFVIQAPSTFHDYVILHSFNENARTLTQGSTCKVLLELSMNQNFTNIGRGINGLQGLKDRLEAIKGATNDQQNIISFIVYNEVSKLLNEIDVMEGIIVSAADGIVNRNDIAEAGSGWYAQTPRPEPPQPLLSLMYDTDVNGVQTIKGKFVSLVKKFIYLNDMTPYDYMEKTIKNRVAQIYQKINRFSSFIKNKVGMLKNVTLYDSQQEIFDLLFSFIQYYIKSLTDRGYAIPAGRTNPLDIRITGLALQILSTLNITMLTDKKNELIIQIIGRKTDPKIKNKIKSLLGGNAGGYEAVLNNPALSNVNFRNQFYDISGHGISGGETIDYFQIVRGQLISLNGILDFKYIPNEKIVMTDEEKEETSEGELALDYNITVKISLSELIELLKRDSIDDSEIEAIFKVNKSQQGMILFQRIRSTLNTLKNIYNNRVLNKKRKITRIQREIKSLNVYEGDRINYYKIALTMPPVPSSIPRRSTFIRGGGGTPEEVDLVPLKYYANNVDDITYETYKNEATRIASLSGPIYFKKSLCYEEVQQYIRDTLPEVENDVYSFAYFIKELFETYMNEDACASNMDDDVTASMSYFETFLNAWVKSPEITDMDLLKQIGFYLFDDRATSYVLNALDPVTDLKLIMSKFIDCVSAASEEDANASLIDIEESTVSFTPDEFNAIVAKYKGQLTADNFEEIFTKILDENPGKQFSNEQMQQVATFVGSQQPTQVKEPWQIPGKIPSMIAATAGGHRKSRRATHRKRHSRRKSSRRTQSRPRRTQRRKRNGRREE
jgi:hypothetical protein